MSLLNCFERDEKLPTKCCSKQQLPATIDKNKHLRLQLLCFCFRETLDKLVELQEKKTNDAKSD